MKITSLIKSKIFSIFSHKILFCSLLLIFASFSLFGVEYKTKSSSSTLSWFDENSWQDIDGNGTGDIPVISGKDEVEIYLYADMVAESSDANANVETIILEFNKSGTNAIHIYFNGHTFDVKNAIKVGSNTTSQVFTSTKGNHGNLYLHGKGNFYVGVLEFGQDAKRVTDWWGNYPENKIYLTDELNFYINQHVSPYHCIAAIDNPEGTKFYLNASGMNLNWYNQCDITFTKDPTPYGEQTFYKITEDGKNPTLPDGKTITFTREGNSSSVENTIKYKVQFIEKDSTNEETWKLVDGNGDEDEVLLPSDGYDYSVTFGAGENSFYKILKATGTVDVGDGIIITFRTPDNIMDMCEIRYIKGELLWTGASDTDGTNFLNPDNYSYSEEITDLTELLKNQKVIVASAKNYPIIQDGTEIKGLEIRSGAKVSVNGNLTVNEDIRCIGIGKIDATNGTVTFTGSGNTETPSFVAETPELSKFGSLVVAENIEFYTESDLHITTTLTNNGSFSAGKVYFEINDTSETATITGKTGDSSEIAEETKIAELYCENQANKNLKIINAISVGNIYISGKQDTDGNRLSVTGGTIYLENDYEDAKYLVLSDDLPTIKNGYITASKSKVEITDKPAFSAKNWKYDDGGEYPVWKGTEDTKWNNENNWNFYGVPTADTNDYVVISADGHSPIISSEVEIKKLLIQDGANLSLDENGKLTISESLNCAETGNIDASAGTVIFTGKGTAENPSFEAKYPEFSTFGTIEVASGTFNLNYPLTLTQLNIASGAIFSTSNELVISSIENSGDFSTTADLHITKSLTNSGTFQAEKVYLEPVENEITITGQSGDSSDIANKTKISELYCINQAGKNLVINNAISVGKIALSGSSDNRLSIIGNGIIYLETECGDDENDIAQYLDLDENSLPKIENQYITVSDGQFSSENNDIFVENHWINGDAIEYKWVGGASGNENNWNERTNWNIRKVPGEDKKVIIPACPNPPILVGQSVTVKTIENNGTIDFAGSTVKTDSITNNGTIDFAGSTVKTDSITNNGTVKLTGNETFKKPDDTKTSLNNGEASTVIYYGTNENAEFVWGGSYEKLVIEEGFSGSFTPSGTFQSSTSFSVANSIEVENGKVFTKKDATKDYVLALGGAVKIENKIDSLTIDSEGEQNYNFDIEFEKSVVLKSNGSINFPANSEKKFNNGLTLETTKDFFNTGNLISENGDISITSANFENAQSSELSANTGKITISATGDFTNAGTITAAGTLVVNQVENFTNSGNITAYGVEIDAIGDFTNSGKIDSSSELLKITAKSITTFGEIDAQSGEFESTETDILFAENSASTFIAGLTVTSAENFKNEGIITAESGAISITAKTFTNAEGKTISAKTGFTCEITDIFTNAGTITASEVEIDATGDFTNAGTITVAGTLVVNQVENFTNSGNITALGVEIDAIGDFTNSGSFISENGDITITSASFENAQSSELSAKSGKITISATGNFTNSGTITAAGKLVINPVINFTNTDNITAFGVEIVATGDFTNSGKIDSSSELLKIIAKSITTSGEINAQSGDFESTEAGIVFAANSETTFEAGLVVTSAGNFENCGAITAESGAISITSANFENAQSSELSAKFGKMTIITTGDFTNAGTITAAGNLVVNQVENFTNTGNITASGVEIVATGDFTNSGSFISENGDINITSANFENAQSSEISAKSGKITISATGDFTNAGAITAAGKLVINPVINFTNTDNITAFGVEIDATGDFKNEGNLISENGDINITSANFKNAQSSEIFANTGKITISATGNFTNSGTIDSSTGFLKITAKSITTSGEIDAQSGEFISTELDILFGENSETTFEAGLVVNSAANFENCGNITAYEVEIGATGDFTNSGKIDSSTGLLKITAKSITTSGEIKANSGDFESTESDILFGENSETSFEAGLTVTSAGNFTNSGNTTASGIEIVAIGNFKNEGSFTSENGDISIKSANFENASLSEISANSGKITISATGDFTNAGNIDSSTGLLKITAKSITTSGEIKANSGEFISTASDILFAENSETTFEAGLTVTSAGNFENYGAITASEVEIVATGDFKNSGSFISENGDITITSASFENSQSSELSAKSGKMTITATGDFTNAGKIDSSNDLLKITAKSITTSGEIKANSGEFISTESDILFGENSETTFEAGLTVTSAGNFENSGTITALGVEIEATGDFTNSGKIDSSSELLKITAKSITTSGEIKAKSGEFISTESDILFGKNSENTFEAGLTITSAGNFTNTGNITALGVEIGGTGDFTNSGNIDSSTGLLKITAKSITTFGEINAQSGDFESTEAGIVFAANSETTFEAGLTVTSADNFENCGTITAYGVEIDATGNFTNAGNIDSSTGLLKITAKSITTSGEIKANSGEFISTESDILFAENSASTFIAGLTVTSAGNFENDGSITAYGIEIVATGDFTNSGKLISENGDISIKSANFENASLSEIAANKDFVCNVTESFSNAGIITSASGKVDINTKSFINKNYNLETPAKIKTENGLINVTTSNFENSSDISAYLDFTCAEPEIFTNAGTITSETGKIDVKAQIMENPGSLFAINGKIYIFTELFETTKEIFGKNIDINSQSSIFAGLVKSGAGDIYISSDLLITHPVEFCLGGSLIIGTVENSKNLVISSLDKNQNATEVKFSQNDDLESIETKVIVSGYAIIFNGNVTLSTNIDIANDFVLLNGITSGENSIYRDSITEIDGLFAYNLFERGDFDFIDFPSDLPFSIEDNKLTTKTISHEKYNTHFSIAEGKIISVGKNFYCNGVDLGLNTSAEWFLKIPGNDVATSAFAECYNASIKNCKVAANTNPEDYAWLSTENAKDETGNTNVAFSKAVLSSTEVSTISDNIIFIKFIDELNGKEIKIENSCNEISAWLENFRFNVSGQISEDNPGIQFTGVYENPECTESTDGKGDLSTFYLKYEIPTDGSIDYRWNTDAIGNSYGSEESTDSSGNYKKVIPNIAFERALTASYAGLRDEHKNRLVSVGTDDIGSNPLFTETKDKASPVLIAVTLGQEQHETDASSQHHYDSHNFIDWQFSEPVEFENYPKNGISQIDSVDTSANSENIQATATFGKITNQGNGFVVAGLGSFSSGKITTGSKTGLGEVNAFYRNFALDVDEKGSSYNPKIKPTRLRLSIAGYVEEENPINYKGEIYNNWLGFIDSKNTTIPSGTFTMPSSISTSIIDKRGNRGEAMEQTVSVNDFLNRYDKEKTLYGTWDIDSPVVSSYMKENLTTIEFEEVIPVDFSQSLSAQGLEIHFLDNSSYNQFEGYSNWKWRTKIGWLYKNESTEITLPLDNKGGSRMTFAENKTGGGLRLSSIVDSIEALSCKNLDLEKAMTFTTDFSQSTTYEAFFGKSEDLAFDVPYLSLRFSELSKEFSLNNNYELLYSRHDSQGNPIGFITDLAGNLLYDFTVNSPDKNPPKIFLSIGAVHKDKLYIMFSKKLDWKDSNGNADEGKLRRIVKSLSIFDSKGNDTGLIDYKKGSRTKIVTETEKSTGIEISLTRTISYEELKNLYIGVNVFDSRDELIAGDGDKSKEDSISGEHGNFSMLYDLYENPASKDLKHCLSDFAVNALDVLYAYDGRVADEAILAQGVYGGNQWTVTNFTENKDNSSQIISDKDISIVSKIKDPSSLEKQDKFSMIADISPNLQSTGSDFKIYTNINPRLWFTDYIKFFSTEPNNSENIEKDNIGSISGKIENIVSGDKNQNITFVLPNHPKNENSLGWGAGNEIQFLFKVFDKDGNPLMVDGNQDGDFEDDVDHPLFAVRLKDENDLTSIDLWSLNIVDILRQKGGVTILNNVINPLNSEECAIEITIPKAGNLTVQVLTLDGNVVKVIQRGRVEEGTYYYKWNGKNISGDSVARGMYFIRVVGPNIEETRKVMVVW